MKSWKQIHNFQTLSQYSQNRHNQKGIRCEVVQIRPYLLLFIMVYKIYHQTNEKTWIAAKQRLKILWINSLSYGQLHHKFQVSSKLSFQIEYLNFTFKNESQSECESDVEYILDFILIIFQKSIKFIILLKLEVNYKYSKIMSIFHRHSQYGKRRRVDEQWMKQLQIQSVIQNANSQQKSSDVKAKLGQIINSQWFLVCMGVITIYSIFDIDVQKSFFDVNVCVYTSTIHAICMLVFFAQITSLIYTKQNYAFSFYFWIDVFSTLTMLLQLIWIENLMSNSSNVTVAISLAKLTKASRLSKIGARSSKIMKLIRLMNFIKILNPSPIQPPKQQGIVQHKIQNIQNQDISEVEYECIQNRSQFHILKSYQSNISKKQLNFKQSNFLQLFNQNSNSNNQKYNQEIIQLQGKNQIQSQNSCSISEQNDDINVNHFVDKIFQDNIKRPSKEEQINKRKSSRSSRLSFLKRKELMDLNRVKQKQKRFKQINQNRFNGQFSNIIQNLEKHIYLPPIERNRVDPIIQEIIDERYKKLVEKQNQSSSKDKTLISGENLKVGQLLKEEIQKNIVVLVMGLIIAIPIITSSTWIDNQQSLSLTSNLFFYGMDNLTDQALSDLVVNFIQVGLQVNTPLVYFDLPINGTCCQFPQDFPSYVQNSSFIDISRLRLSQQSIIIDPSNNLTIIFSRRTIMSITSMLNVGRSFFITLLLIFSSILFMRDIETYALDPLQKMSTLINKISINPFQALKQINRQKDQEKREVGQIQQPKYINKHMKIKDQDNLTKNKLQTNILQDLVIKITSLLALGAGQVGSQLISQNIDQINPQNQLNQSQEANDSLTHRKHSIKGQKHIAVYVYIRFCHFQQICDIFGDSVFHFINLVTRIVHMNAVKYCGIPIQYDGEGFLLMWKSQQAKQAILERSHYSLKSQIDTNLTKLSLLAIQYLIKTTLDVSALQQTKTLLNFLQQQTNCFQQNYEPHIFYSSIHVGQSIQGSMGSTYKLEYKCFGYDISYVRFLSDLAQSYDLSNLISSDVIVMIEQYQGIINDNCIRKIDQIKIKIQKQSSKNALQGEDLSKTKKQQKNKDESQLAQNLVNLSYNSIYTLDFYANANEQEYMNQANLKTQKQINGKILTLRQKILQKNIQKTKRQEESLSEQNRQQDQDEILKRQSIKAYQLRDMWEQKISNCSVFQIHKHLKQFDQQVIAQSRKQFKQEFYYTWNDALWCYFLKDWGEAIHSFKSIHTQNSFYDNPAKIMIKRIEKHRQNQNEQWDSYQQVVWSVN